MAKVLVTGGAGYIGSHVVTALADNGHDVIVFDNLSTGFAEAVDSRAKLIVGDLTDGAAVRTVLRDGIDAVLHFAANIVVPESIENPLKYYTNNTTNTTNLVSACVELGVQRFIFSSTAAVYGTPESGEADEGTPTEPINPYGRSKLMSEWVLRDAAAASELRYVALRYFNVAGAAPDGKNGQRTRGATHLITVAAQAALGRRDEVHVFGTDYGTPDGTGVRDYIHIQDLASAHIAALDHLLNDGTSETLNCGYGHGASVREVLSTMQRVSGVDFNIVEAPRRTGDSAKLIANADRIRRVLDWTPQFDDLELICRSAFDWEQTLDPASRV